MIKPSVPKSKGKWFGVVGLYTMIPCTIFLMTRWSAWQDSEARLRGNIKEATEALAERCEELPPDRRKALLLTYTTDNSPNLRLAAINTFEEQGITDIAPTLETAYRDSSSLVRQRAIEIMQQIEPERGARLLLAGMADDDNWIRRSSIAQLNILASHSPDLVGDRALPILIAGVQDSDTTVSSMSSSALRKLTGKPWHISGLAKPEERSKLVKQWKDWWTKNEKTVKVAPEYFHIAPILPERTDPAPNFSLTDLEDRPIRLSDQQGKITLLFFWATWWKSASGEIPILNILSERYSDRGLDAIGFAIREPKGKEGLQRWCEEHPVSFRQALATAKIREVLGAHELPVTILLDRQNRIRYRWDGERDLRTYEKAIQRLMAE